MDMQELRHCQSHYRQIASGLPNYQELTKQQIGDGYCDADEAGNETLKSQYFAAAMLRYWNKIFGWMNDSKSLHLQPEDFVSWLEDSLIIAFRYRSWRDPEKDVYQDPNGFDKVVNQCCFSTRGREYQFVNKDKRKANVIIYSIDAGVDENGDCALDFSGAVEDDCQSTGARSLVLNYLNRNRNIEALIIDAIAFQDAFKEIKSLSYMTTYDEETETESVEEVVNYKHSFDQRKLVQHLSHINQEFMQEYFAATYDVDDDRSNQILSQLKALNPNKLRTYIKKTLLQLADDDIVKQCLLN